MISIDRQPKTHNITEICGNDDIARANARFPGTIVHKNSHKFSHRLYWDSRHVVFMGHTNTSGINHSRRCFKYIKQVAKLARNTEIIPDINSTQLR